MKRFCVFLFLLTLSLSARCAEEDQWLDVLHSGSSLRDKDAACAKLKWIATTRAIPVLSELLANDDLSHSARYVLESLPGPEAEQALLAALAKTSGSNEVGVINSLGVRRDKVAAPDIARLLANTDTNVAAAAAHALGQIGGPTAIDGLRAAWIDSGPGPVHDAQGDGLLACANQLLTSGNKRAAAKLFQQIYDQEKRDDVRLAAFRGVILASEKRGILLMMQALQRPESPNQGAALQLAAKEGSHATTAALAHLLQKVPLAEEIALLQALAQRGDRDAEMEVVDLLASPDRNVRMAAISTLGEIGDGHVAFKLAKAAAAAKSEERTAAREALINLRRGPVTEIVLKQLPSAPPEAQAELIRALGDRGDSAAAPRLLDLARTSDGALRSDALQALAVLAGPAQIPGMIHLVIDAPNADNRSEAADALSSACQHVLSQKGQVDGTRLAQAVLNAPPEVRAALLAVCSGVNDARVRDAMRAAANDPNELVRAAAIRAICASQDEQLLPDMLIICNAPGENFRMLGVRGCVRMITQEQNPPLPVSQKIDLLKALLKTPLNAEGKRQVLSGLASIGDAQSLQMAKSMLDDADVQTEAAAAVKQITAKLK